MHDEVNTYDRAGNAQIKDLSSRPVRAAGRQMRIDHFDVEKFRIYREISRMRAAAGLSHAAAFARR
jgi:hypothetical protein